MSAKAILHIRLLGNLSITAPNHEPVQIPPSRTGALLALLAVDISNRLGCSREEIVDAIWPEDEPEEARHKLRQTLYDLRRKFSQLGIMPEKVLRSTRTSLQLAPDLVSVDAVDFEAILVAAGKVSDPKQRGIELEAAVAKYLGELLPGFYQERFIQARTRLETEYQSALKSLMLAYEETEQYEQGIGNARKLVALNPLDEEARFVLMRLYAITGQPSSVLQQYQSWERVLQQELGESPGRSAQSIMETLRENALIRAAERDFKPTPMISHAASSAANVVIQPNEIEADELEEIAEPLRFPIESNGEIGTTKLKARWPAVVAGPTIAALFLLILLVSMKRHHVSANIPTIRAAPTENSHTPYVLARYTLAADERGSEPTTLTTDFAGNLYVAGFVETTKNDADFITLKYNSEGRLLWRARYNGTGNDVDRLRCIGVDKTGYVYVSGESDNGKGNGSTRLSGLDVVTIKYDSNGNELWQRRYNDVDDGDDRPVKMLLDSVGNAYILCCCHRLGNGKDRGCDFVLIKYNQDGKQLWLQRYDGEAQTDSVPTDMALLYKDAGVCVCGYSKGTYKTGPEYDFETIEYSANGKQLWRQRYGAGNLADDFARDISADPDGNVFVVGEGRGLPGTPDESRTGCIVVKYNAAGEMQWARGTVKESDRLQHITAASFWTDGSLAVAGPVVNENGVQMFRVVLRDFNGGAEQTFDTYAPFHSSYSGPCALPIWSEDIQTHDALWMIGSRACDSGSSLEFIVTGISSHAGVRWQEVFSPADGENSARAGLMCHRGTKTVIVVAGLCMDKHNVGGITLVEYGE